MNNSIAIIIPVHNGLEFTKKCLGELILKSNAINPDDLDLKIIIVDDGSTDGTSDWVKGNCPDVILLHGDGNLWWSGAINTGARFAVENLKAAYVLLWNNDIQVSENYFQLLGKLIVQSNKNTIIGSMIYCDPEFSRVWSAGGKFNPYSGEKYMIWHMAPDSEELGEIIEADWLTGMGTLVPAQIIQKIGYWNRKHFPQYYGDADFTYRAKLNGFRILVFHELKIANETTNSGAKKIDKFSEIPFILTNIKSVHHIGKNFLFYWLYAKTPWAFFKFIMIYIIFFGSFFKRKITGLFSRHKE